MKKAFLFLLLNLAFTTAFAQGKLQFATDSRHLVYYNPDPLYLSGYMNSNAVSAGNMPFGVTLVADLYAGTSSSLLSLVSTAAFSSSFPLPGRWMPLNTLFTSPALPASVAAFFQIQIRDIGHPTAAAAEADLASGWRGFSSIFTAAPQPSSYNPIYQPTIPVSSTWAPGTFNMDNVGPGDRGAIAVTGPIPEPSGITFVGSAVAAVLMLRRRKAISQ